MRALSFCLLTALGLPTLAQAQETGGMNAHGFVLAPQDGDVRDGWVLHRPGAMQAKQWFLGGVFEYANKPLVLVTELPGEEQQTQVALDHVAALNLSGGYTFHERVRLAVSAPVYLTSTGLDGGQGAAFGDVRTDLMVSLVAPNDGGFGLAVVPWLDLPIGPSDKFLGQAKLGGGALAAATYELDKATLTANLGMQFNPKVQVENLDGADALIAGIGANYLLNPSSTVGVEAHFTTPFATNDRKGTGSPAEALVSYRKRLESGGFFTGGLALPLSSGVGAANFRLIVGGGFGKAGGTAGPRDKDMDGVLDKVDSCPNEPETKNGYIDQDGCPDSLAKLTVKVVYGDKPVQGAKLQIQGPDGTIKAESGEQDWSDDVRPESMWRITANKGACLTGESKQLVGNGDHEAVVQMTFQASASMEVHVHNDKGQIIPGAKLSWNSKNPECVPTAPGLDTNGKAQQDIGPGNHRLVVGAPGYRVVEVPVFVEPGDHVPIEVTLKATKLRVEAKRIVILEKVQFESGKSVIKRESYDLLNEVAEVLRRNAQAGDVEIKGYTDDQGTDSFNLSLSQKRADAVLKFLAAAKVDKDRMQAVGYGESSPIADNGSASGRAANRRVEFHLKDQDSNTIEEPAPK